MLGVAVLGLGWWGRQIVRSLANSDALRVVRVVEPDAAPHAAFAAEHGLPLSATLTEALADAGVEAAILCTPQALHTAQVVEAAAAGRHVFCEKPLALTRADAKRSVAACAAAGVVLGIGHERRFEPAMRRLRDLLRAGDLGTPLHVEANFSHAKLTHLAPGDWRVDSIHPPAHTGMGIHLTDMFLDLLGPIETIQATAAQLVSNRPRGDTVTITARFASGATGFASAILETPLYIACRLFGSAAWAEIRNASHPDTPGPATLTVEYRDGRRTVEKFAWEDAVSLNLRAFAAAVAGTAPYPFTDAQKIANVAVLEAVAESATTGQPIRLAPIPS